MAPHEIRVVEEAKELHDKLTKLRAFIASPKYGEIPAPGGDLLINQEYYMTQYLRVLDQRIEGFRK